MLFAHYNLLYYVCRAEELFHFLFLFCLFRFSCARIFSVPSLSGFINRRAKKSNKKKLSETKSHFLLSMLFSLFVRRRFIDFVSENIKFNANPRNPLRAFHHFVCLQRRFVEVRHTKASIRCASKFDNDEASARGGDGA